MESEEMKKIWDRTDARLASLETQVKKISETRNRTALDSLAARYRRFAILGIAVALMFAMQSSGRIFSGTYGLIASLLGVALGLSCSAADWWLWRKLGSIDIARMSVSEVAERAMACRRVHLMFMFWSIPLAIATVTLIALSLKATPYMTASILTGAAIGLAIGICQLRRFLADYRALAGD